jgi:Protein of unknown function (DUF3800)
LFRLFIDEFGHQDLKGSDDPDQQYLGLTGIVMDEAYASGTFTGELNKIKANIFGRDDFPLHRRDILRAQIEPYRILNDPKIRTAFDLSLVHLIEESHYKVITVIIDKKLHKHTYSVWRFHPYHYCMTCLLERYVLMLEGLNAVGDVMVESREKIDNIRLAKAYRYFYKKGTPNLNQDRIKRRLSSVEIKIKRKADNIAGLQMADMIANPSCRELICIRLGQAMTADFSRKVVSVLNASKYRRSTSGKIVGWGTKWLP